MAKPTKGKRNSRAGLKIANAKKKRKAYWLAALTIFNAANLKHQQGKEKSIAEKKLIISSLSLLLSKEIELLKLRGDDIMKINWTGLETQLALDLGISRACITEIRKAFFATGEIMEPVNNRRGQAADNYTKQVLLDKEQLCDLVHEVDKNHALGRSVTNMLMRNYIRYTHQINISRTQMARYMKSLGLTWKPIRAKKKTASDYRMELLFDYIIKFNEYYLKVFDNNQIESDYVFVFTDESYIHKGHGRKMTYVREGGPDVNRKSSKGERLVIMHAITHQDILAGKDTNDRPIEDTEWIGDTPHPKVRDDYKTCETLWKASSNSGDYHDNMNSDMFMKWVEEKLIPTFNHLHCQHKDKKMILVCDNAAYHHKRDIGSYASQTKDYLVNECIKHGVEYIDLPATTNRIDYLHDNIMTNADLLPDQEWIRVTFDEDEKTKWRKKSTKKSLFVPTLEELKYGIVRYLQEHKPELLECKVTKLMNSLGHHILWTPPYCPHLQPIELFWAAGKNHAASCCLSDTDMYDTVRNLRDGWYGNGYRFKDVNKPPPYHILPKEKVDCKRLFDHCVENINTIAIPVCPGIEGKIGALLVDPAAHIEHHDLPIDIFLLGIDAVMDEASNALDNDGINDDDNEENVAI